MKCPICMRTEFIKAQGESHYLCKKDSMIVGNETISGCGAQFRVIRDEYVRFPYNMIFRDRSMESFFNQPLLVINNPSR